MKLLKNIPLKFNIYLLKELSQILLLSLGILTFIMVLSRLAKLADLVINKGVGMSDIIMLLAFSIPPYLTFTLPMAFLLSVIVVLGRLSTENEILVLKASGVNLRWLFVPIVFLGLIVTACGLFNTNTLLPSSSGFFRETLINIVKKGISVDDKEGVFNDTVPGVVIYIDNVDSGKGGLSGVVVSDDRDSDIKQTISAKKGFVNIDPDTFELYFMLENGSLHRWEKETDTYRNINFEQYTFTMNLNEMMPRVSAMRKPTWEMDRKELRGALANTTDKDRRYDLLIEIYKKISLPLSPLAFVILTIPLGVRRKVEGKFSGALYSLFLFIFYYILMALTESLGKLAYVPPLFMAFVPNIIIIAIGVYLVRSLNREDHQTLSQTLKYIWATYFEKIK